MQFNIKATVLIWIDLVSINRVTKNNNPSPILRVCARAFLMFLPFSACRVGEKTTPHTLFSEHWQSAHRFLYSTPHNWGRVCLETSVPRRFYKQRSTRVWAKNTRIARAHRQKIGGGVIFLVTLLIETKSIQMSTVALIVNMVGSVWQKYLYCIIVEHSSKPDKTSSEKCFKWRFLWKSFWPRPAKFHPPVFLLIYDWYDKKKIPRK